jgi:hypothetical protein
VTLFYLLKSFNQDSQRHVAELVRVKEALNKWIPLMPFDKLRRAFDKLSTMESIRDRSSLVCRRT